MGPVEDLSSTEMKTSMNSGIENKYELWEVEFLAFMRIQKLYDVFVRVAYHLSSNNASSIEEWHKILGNCNYGDVRKLEQVVKGMKITDHKEPECEVCTQGKMCQTRSGEPDQRAKAPLEFVHCDLAGPIEPTAKDGFKYALSFVDDFTGINMVYFLKQKSDTTEATEKYIADVAPYGKIKRLRSDNGGEFISYRFKSLIRKHAIKYETSAPYSPHQNGT
jgi:hypothetical protein